MKKSRIVSRSSVSFSLSLVVLAATSCGKLNETSSTIPGMHGAIHSNTDERPSANVGRASAGVEKLISGIATVGIVGSGANASANSFDGKDALAPASHLAGSVMPNVAGRIGDPGTIAAAARIITADGTQYEIDELGGALKHALGNSGTRHVIIFVHGRSCSKGGEPKKSLSKAIPSLQSNYHAKALMFTWPGSSAGCPVGFPDSEARESGQAFSHMLHKLAFILSDEGTTNLPNNLTFTLITHSMGNIVLEEALTHDTIPLPENLFSTVILSSSATALAGHSAWLSKLKFSPNLYVSENDGDSVLAAAGTYGARLGRDLGTDELAANAQYVDFSASNVNHAYYLHSGQKGAHMTAFYDTIMTGKAYNFADSTAIIRTETRNGAFVYYFDKR
jgi:hypothetical protein